MRLVIAVLAMTISCYQSLYAGGKWQEDRLTHPDKSVRYTADGLWVKSDTEKLEDATVLTVDIRGYYRAAYPFMRWVSARPIVAGNGSRSPAEDMLDMLTILSFLSQSLPRAPSYCSRCEFFRNASLICNNGLALLRRDLDPKKNESRYRLIYTITRLKKRFRHLEKFSFAFVQDAAGKQLRPDLSKIPSGLCYSATTLSTWCKCFKKEDIEFSIDDMVPLYLDLSGIQETSNRDVRDFVFPVHRKIPPSQFSTIASVLNESSKEEKD